LNKTAADTVFEGKHLVCAHRERIRLLELPVCGERDMNKTKAMLGLLGVLLFAAPPVLVAAPTDANTIVIVFKDGRQQTYSMADIERIDFKTPDSASIVVRGNSFLGKWKVGEGNGGSFYITLERNGTASKTLGASHGTWTVVDNEARISWDDGWHDAIRKVGTKYEKRAFERGKSFTDTPSNVTDAKKTDAQPI